MAMTNLYRPRQYNFTREEIAEELKRCGYPLTSEEDVLKFERDLETLYLASNLEESVNDKFYDIPPPTRDDIDFSKYYTRAENLKSVTTDFLRFSTSKIESTRNHFPLKATKDASKLPPLVSQSVPATTRSALDKAKDLKNTSISSTTKRKVLRKSDDGSSYVDELLRAGRSKPSNVSTKKSQLPLVDGVSEFPPLSPYGFSNRASLVCDALPLEDKISQLTLVSEGSTDSALMKQSYEANNGRKLSATSGSHSPLRLSDRDNRQAPGVTKQSAKNSTDSTMLPSVIRPVTQPKGKRLPAAQDPVARYAEYAKAWRTQRAPGEKAHKELRWQIRGQMLARDETFVNSGRRTASSHSSVTSHQRPVSRPNPYVVPTEKKRQSLRWSIRCALAAGRQPPTSTRYVNRGFFSG